MNKSIVWKLGLVVGGVALGVALVPVFEKSQPSGPENPVAMRTNLVAEKPAEKPVAAPETSTEPVPPARVVLKPGPPVIRLAVLDTSEMPQSPAARLAFSKKAQDDTDLIQQAWDGAAVTTLHNADDLHQWEIDRPDDAGRDLIKVIYDRAAAELRVCGTWKGTPFDQSFPAVPTVATALGQAGAFIDRIKAQ